MAEKYSVDEFGVVHEVDPIPIKYNLKYVQERYDTLADRGLKMSFLRLGVLLSQVPGDVSSVLDVGYGNGSFLDACASVGIKTFGTDVSGYPLEGSRHTFLENPWSKRIQYHVVTFFDSLEHIPDLSFIGRIQARFIMISVPWFHPSLGEEWFLRWKHRRPGEHLHHFSEGSVVRFFNSFGYREKLVCSVEDCLRPREAKSIPNILTCVFEKQ